MRLGLLLLLLMATLFGGGYWYTLFDTPCMLPVHYRVGDVDARFGTNKDEIKRIAANAERIWESSINGELFVYDEHSSSLPINLIFDERQQEAELETELRQDLEAKGGMSESVSSQYEALISKFRTLKKQYESRVVAYESKLTAYNAQVKEWNNKGGAPQSVVDELSKTQKELTAEQESLQTLSKQLNVLVTQLNAIGAKGNSLITDYNTIVNEYNERFGETREFAQGDYVGTAINIYQFDSEDDLTIVLAHELGHALSFGHVQNEQSIMYYLMGKQDETVGLTKEDVAEFDRVCNGKSNFVKLLQFVGGSIRSFAS